MTRQLTITAAEWASVQPDGTLWIVREAGWPKACPLADPTACNGEHCDCPLGPPVEFVQACAPCARCKDTRVIHAETFPTPCPYCRVELVGPCPTCKGMGAAKFRNCTICDARGTVTLGYAYAIGQPLPIQHGDTPFNPDPAEAIHVARVNGRWKVGYRKGTTIYTITDRLAHYGLPETLVGRWAIQLRVVQP